MNPIIRNLLAVLAGIIVGSVVNMAIISISGSVISPPEGTNVSTNEGLAAAILLFEPKHFLMPFLAHALGTLGGAFLTARLGATAKMKLALGIGGFFLIGGIGAVMMFPSPMWFNSVDLVFAYIPMAYLGGKLATRNS